MRYRSYTSPRGLYRSRDSVLCGVCGGIAEYFDFSAWGVRCMFILLSLLPIITLPFMVVLYAVLACIMRKSPFSGYRDREYRY